MSYALIADIGGTNARFALAPLLAKHDIHELNEESLREIRKYSGTDFATIGEAIEQYIADIADNYARPSVGLIAIAAAVNQDEIAMINHYWRFSQQQLKADLGFEALFFINEYPSV